MTRVRAAAAATALLLGAPLLTGCGIKPTGVIESGAAGKVAVPNAGTRGAVYFVLPDGQLAPIPETQQPGGWQGDLLLRLLTGPTEQDRAAGLETRLPALDTRKQGASAGTSIVSPDTVAIGVPFRVGDLSETARRQLVCTVASTAPGRRVVLRGPDLDLEPARCDLGS